MPKIMTLPKLGVNMEKATIVEWVVQEGETVEEGQHLFDAETDKAVQEIPATVGGVLARIMAQPGETINCGEPVAVFVEAGETLSEDFAVPLKVANAPVAAVQPRGGAVHSEGRLVHESPSPAKADGGRVRISPLAKKVAKELDVDYLLVPPSRPGVRITKADVLVFSGHRESGAVRVLPSAAPVLTPDTGSVIRETIPLKGVRRIIADRMSQSAHSTARAALFIRADVEELLRWRVRINEDGNRVGLNDLFVLISNIGVAVDTERGLVVPVIRHADQKGAIAISEDFRSKMERARAGKSTLEDLSGGTFTITNLGMFEIEAFVPIINPPECAILATGAIMREPVVVDEVDTIQVRPRIQLCLVWDHRIVDGAPAARFLRRIKQLIEWPLELLS
jgi:pyruvate dehydrogenase E2 component (dihydrolipoamide acetyltransferase)